jgi:predicted nuclease of predicted toxin-antitoxin system
VSEVRFYLDEHVPFAVSIGLRLRGVDVLTVQEAGLSGASDEAHLALAVAEKRVIFTQDEDFLTLAAQGAAHAGVV